MGSNEVNDPTFKPVQPTKWLVTAEVVATHKAVVLALTEDEAADVYLDGKWEKDLGEEFDDNSAMVLSVEPVEE